VAGRSRAKQVTLVVCTAVRCTIPACVLISATGFVLPPVISSKMPHDVQDAMPDLVDRSRAGRKPHRSNCAVAACVSEQQANCALGVPFKTS
jgi:hypothetical protein